VQNVVEMPRIPLLALIENRMTQSEDEVALKEVLKNQLTSQYLSQYAREED